MQLPAYIPQVHADYMHLMCEGHDKVLLVTTVCMSRRSHHIRVAAVETLLSATAEAHLAVLADQP